MIFSKLETLTPFNQLAKVFVKKPYKKQQQQQKHACVMVVNWHPDSQYVSPLLLKIIILRHPVLLHYDWLASLREYDTEKPE